METWRGGLRLVQVQLVDLLQRLRRLSDGVLCGSDQLSEGCLPAVALQGLLA